MMRDKVEEEVRAFLSLFSEARGPRSSPGAGGPLPAPLSHGALSSGFTWWEEKRRTEDYKQQS